MSSAHSVLPAAPLSYALLIGQGRSGTNFLLSLLDQSPATHCRNEPDQLDESALARLSDFRFFVDDEARLAGLFDGAVRDAARRVGPRDHLAEVAKDWLRPGRGGPGYFYLRQRMRLVERLVRLRKPMDGKELVFPRWMADSAALARAFHVFKLNAAVGYGAWALRSRPDARVIQIVRHPGGFLKSWHKRWVKGEGGQERGRGNADRFQDEERLREVARRDARWAGLFGDIGRMERAEGELWWWRWVNETLHAAGEGKDHYTLVLYEDLARDPERVSRAVFTAQGLAWDESIAARVSTIASGAEKIARAWKDELAPEMIALVEKVLAGSPMERWWDEQGGASEAA
jgi:sulfotransferase family protein